MADKVQGAVRGHGEVSELSHLLGGRTTRPTKPIILYGKDERVLTVIITDGDTEAAELEDLAHTTLDRQDRQIQSTGRALNFDEAREKHGMVRREDFGVKAAEAIRRRVAAHRRSHRTDPARQPQYYTKSELEAIRNEARRIIAGEGKSFVSYPSTGSPR